ncbi:MAG: hypothetical protein V1816_25540 [Pseudomonadota bacterium]
MRNAHHLLLFAGPKHLIFAAFEIFNKKLKFEITSRGAIIHHADRRRQNTQAERPWVKRGVLQTP